MTCTSLLSHQLSMVIRIVDINHMAGNVLVWSNAVPGNCRLERFDSETSVMLQLCLWRNNSDLRS